jgi:hypothetical protein
MPQVRDPDALPPRNSTEWVMTLIYKFIIGLGGGNAIFAAKAGLLSGKATNLSVVTCLYVDGSSVV